MKKRIITIVVVCALMSLNVAPALQAQSVSGPSGPAGAQVPTMLAFSLSRVVKMSVAAGDSDPWNQGTIQATPNFDFGQLTPLSDANGKFLYMHGSYFYYVLMAASTSGRRYMITETGTTFTGAGGATLPVNSVLLVPDYQWLDQLGGVAQGAPPGAAVVGPATSACLTNSLIYQSDTGGLGRIVRAILAISGPASGATYPFNWSKGYNGSTGQGSQQNFTTWVPVSQDQTAGTYTGTVTFTLVLD